MENKYKHSIEQSIPAFIFSHVFLCIIPAIIFDLNPIISEIYTGEYRTKINNQGINLHQELIQARNENKTIRESIEYSESEKLRSELYFQFLRIHYGSTKDIIQSYVTSILPPVIGPTFVPTIATMTQFNETKKLIPMYKDWERGYTGGKENHKSSHGDGKFRPIEADWGDIGAFWLGGVIAFGQQWLAWRLGQYSLSELKKIKLEKFPE
jgi:hypothetical protein